MIVKAFPCFGGALHFNALAPSRKTYKPAGVLAVMLVMLMVSHYPAQPAHALEAPLPNSGHDLEVTVPVQVTADKSAPSLTLHFLKPAANRAFTIWRKDPQDYETGAWGTELATTAQGATSWTDTTVEVGVPYEYRIKEIMPEGVEVPGDSTGTFGYVLAGIEVDKTGSRGRVAVVIEENIRNWLSEEVDQYLLDLAGDGWTVHTILTPTGNFDGTGNLHQPIREQIKAIYNTYPGELKMVSLLGPVPQPRTGLYGGFFPDGHGNRAAFGADAYYAEMDDDDFWTDTGSNGESRGEANEAGDGKFDPMRIPNDDNEFIELGYGRIDLRSTASGVGSLRNYLGKVHRYKNVKGEFANIGRRTMFRGGGFDSVGEPYWNSMPNIVGLENMEYISNIHGVENQDNDFRYSEITGPFLFYFKGNGFPNQAGHGGQGVIWTGFQSNWGYWTSSSDMVNRLSENNLCLSFTWSTWSWRYYFHRMALGDPIGDVMKNSVNVRPFLNDDLYEVNTDRNANGDYSGYLFMNNMGDPLVRTFMIKPARALSAVPTENGVRLNWQPSEEPGLAGYHVYRSDSKLGPYTRLSTAPVDQLSWFDGDVDTGAYFYMVRAVKIDEVGSGSIINGSQGIFAEVDLDAAPAALTVSTAALPEANWLSPYSAQLSAEGGQGAYGWKVNGTLPEGLELDPIQGLITGEPAQPGSFALTAIVTDGTGATAQQALTLEVSDARCVELIPVADAGISSGNNADKNYGDDDGIGGQGEVLMKFDLSQVPGDQVVEATLILHQTRDNRLTQEGDTMDVSLTQDAEDGWDEHAVTYNTRPSPDGSVTPITFSGPWPEREGVDFSIDVTSLIAATISNDPARIASLHLGDVTQWRQIQCASKEAYLHDIHPRLVLKIRDQAPALQRVSPARNFTQVLPNHDLKLAVKLIHDGDPPTTPTVTWSTPEVPAGASVNFDPAAEGEEVVANFSDPGLYVIQATATDGDGKSRSIQWQVLVSAADFPGGPLPDLARFPFDEESGSTAENTLGGPDGTLMSLDLPEAWNSSGRFNGALDLSQDTGTTGFVKLAEEGDYPIEGTDDYTLSFWVKSTQSGNDEIPITGKQDDAGTDFMVRVNLNTGGLQGNTGGVHYPQSHNRQEDAGMAMAGALNNGEWHHLVLVNEGSKGITTLYDEAGHTQIAQVSGDFTEDTAADWLLGTLREIANGGTNGDFDGLIDELRLYGRALSGEELEDLFAQGDLLNKGPQISIAPPPLAEPNAATALSATVTDDGLPANTLTLQWFQTAGPATATISGGDTGSPTVRFPQPGVYTLRLCASDGAIETGQEVQVTVGELGILMDGTELQVTESGGGGTSTLSVGLPSASEAGVGLNVTLASAPASDVVLNVTSLNPGIATVSPATLTFTPDNWSTPQPVTITGQSGITGTAQTTVRIAVDDAGSDDAWDGLSDIEILVEVFDADAGFSVSPANLTLVENGETGTLTVSLLSRPTSDVVLDLSSSDTANLAVLDSQLTFTPANWSTPQIARVYSVNDSVIVTGGSAQVTVSVNQPLSDDAFDPLPDDIVTVNLTNDDEAGLSVSPAELTIAETETATFNVVLNTRPQSNVVLNINSSDTAEATVDKPTVTFEPAQLNQPQTITVLAVNDNDVVDQTAQLTVSVDAAQSADAFDSLPAENIALQLINNDFPGSIYFATTNINLEEDAWGTRTISVERTGGFGPASADVVQDSDSPGDVTLGEDYEVSPTTLTWADGDTTPKEVMITVFADQDPEDFEYGKLTLANVTGAERGLDGSKTSFWVYIGNDDYQPVPAQRFGSWSEPFYFDLNGKTATWSPNAEGSYDGFIHDNAEFPNDPANGTAITFAQSDGTHQLDLPGGLEIPFFGVNHSTLYIGEDGYVTFGVNDPSSADDLRRIYSPSDWAPEAPRAAIVWDNLDPTLGGDVIVEVDETPGQEKVVVTYLNVQCRNSDHQASAQAEFWKNGTITMTWKDSYAPIDDYYTVAVALGVGTKVPGFQEIDISALPLPSVLINYQDLPLATLGTPYNHTIQAAGGSTPYGWAITAGDTAPATLTLDPATGEISGTPDASGIYTFTVQVTDDGGNQDAEEFTLKVISLVSDIDENGLTDQWELDHFGDIGQDPAGNPDEDGADNQAEHDAGSDPNVADTDSDGVEDGPEITLTRDPTALDRQNLDWVEEFDGTAAGALLSEPRLWAFDGTFTANLTAGGDFSDGWGLTLSTGQEQTAVLIQHLDAGFEPVVWVDFTAQLAPYGDDAEDPTVQDQTNSAFFITENGDVKALDGSTWQTFAAEVPAGLVRYTVRQDFRQGERNWQLWINGSLVTGSPLAFNSASTQTTIPYFRIQQAEQQEALFDAISVSRAAPAGLAGVEYFGDWHGDRSWSGDDTPGGNPNKNNLTNLQEYAFGFDDPVDGNHTYQTEMEIDDGGPYLKMTFRRNRAAHDVRYIVEKCNVLGNWQPVRLTESEIEINPHPTDAGVDLITVCIPAGEESLYMRLRTELRTAP